MLFTLHRKPKLPLSYALENGDEYREGDVKYNTDNCDNIADQIRGDKDDVTDASTYGDVDIDNDPSNDNGDAYNDADDCDNSNGDFYHTSEGISDTCDQSGSDEYMNINSDVEFLIMMGIVKIVLMVRLVLLLIRMSKV